MHELFSTYSSDTCFTYRHFCLAILSCELNPTYDIRKKKISFLHVLVLKEHSLTGLCCLQYSFGELSLRCFGPLPDLTSAMGWKVALSLWWCISLCLVPPALKDCSIAAEAAFQGWHEQVSFLGCQSAEQGRILGIVGKVEQGGVHLTHISFSYLLMENMGKHAEKNCPATYKKNLRACNQ